MPLYDLRCAEHGVRETFALTAAAIKGDLPCPDCGALSPQVIGPAHGQNIRIACGGEDSRDPKRIRDGTARYNLGLGGVDTVVGRRRDGKPKLAYRPITNAELGSNRGVLEHAKKQGLTPVEGAAYRSVGR